MFSFKKSNKIFSEKWFNFTKSQKMLVAGKNSLIESN